MNASRYVLCLQNMGWSRRTFARHLGIHPDLAHRYAMGRVVIPDDVAEWLEMMVRLLAENRPPDMNREGIWRVRRRGRAVASKAVAKTPPAAGQAS